MDPIAIGYYYAIILYVKALRSTYLEGYEIFNGSHLLYHMTNVTYRSSIGSNIQIDQNGDFVESLQLIFRNTSL